MDFLFPSKDPFEEDSKTCSNEYKHSGIFLEKNDLGFEYKHTKVFIISLKSRKN